MSCANVPSLSSPQGQKKIKPWKPQNLESFSVLPLSSFLRSKSPAGGACSTCSGWTRTRRTNGPTSSPTSRQMSSSDWWGRSGVRCAPTANRPSDLPVGSPWYNCKGWLGVKHLVSHLLPVGSACSVPYVTDTERRWGLGGREKTRTRKRYFTRIVV